MAASVDVSSKTIRTGSRLGEVIETTSAGHWAESYILHELPPLGALVSSTLPDGQRNYGIVAFGQTGGLDPSRRAIKRGGENLSDSAIYDRHPELEHILRTLFRVAAVGYQDRSRIRHSVPPLPVPLHYTVHACDADEVSRFVPGPRYFASLLHHQGEISAEDLLAAHIRWVDEALDDNHQWLSEATRQVASLMKRDYDRLFIVLDSVDPE